VLWGVANRAAFEGASPTLVFASVEELARELTVS
jgi:hypothetical protein